MPSRLWCHVRLPRLAQVRATSSHSAQRDVLQCRVAPQWGCAAKSTASQASGPGAVRNGLFDAETALAREYIYIYIYIYIYTEAWFGRMLEAGLSPDELSFGFVIRACAEACPGDT